MDGRSRWFASLAFLLALLVVLSGMPVFALSSDEIQDQIDELKEEETQILDRIKELEQLLDENLEEMRQIVQQKDAVDQQIFLLNDHIANINSRIQAYGLLVADKQDELDAAREKLRQLNEKYKDRIRAMEEEGRISYWTVLFRSNSFADFLDRLNMIREIAQADRKRLEELTAASDRVEEAKRELETEKESLLRSREDLEQTQEELREKRAQADALLQELVAREEEFEALLEESEQQQEALMQQLAQKEDEYDQALYEEWLQSYIPPQTTTPAPQPPEDGSGWITPVPYYTLTSPFGMRMHPILGYERMHNGVDLACAEGTPIYASRGGQVEVTGYQKEGAGNYVQINHGGGYRSIYMHMTHYIVKTGEYVAAGQVIGYVGSTGLSKGNHLHFGISYNGTYVNPMEYIG